MNILITCVLIVLALFKKKSQILCLLLFLLMWTLWGWNVWNGDYEAYKALFYDSLNIKNAQEFLFLSINTFFLKLGFSYQSYQIIYSFIVLFLFYKIIKNNTPLPALFSIIYFLIFIQEFVYMRNYLANILILCSIFVVINNKSKRFYIGYILVVLLSSFIHSTTFLFLIFLPFLNENLYSFKKIFLYSISFFLLIIWLVEPYIFPLLGSFFLEKMNYYSVVNHGITNSSYLHIILVLSTYAEYKYVVSKIAPLVPNKDNRMFIIIRNFNLISLFFISFYYLFPYFANRFLRLLFTINLFYTISACYYAYQSNIKRNELISILCLLLLLFSILLFLSISNLPYTLIPLYKCNLIWGNEYYEPI